MSKITLRNILLGGLLILFLVIIFLFRSRMPFGRNQSSFAIDPGKNITRIELFYNGGRVSLSKKGDEWVVNGKYEARKSAVYFIIRILTEIQIKSPVSPGLFRTEVTEKGINPVRVKVFEKGRQLKSFLVYRTGSNIYGNMMKMRERSKPFIVYVPGFDGDIGSGFIPDELFWRPFIVFNLLPSEISSVKVENKADTSSSFSISCRNSTYTLSGSEGNLSGWDPARISRYLTYFTRITFEQWVAGLSADEKEKIENTKPVFRFEVRKTDGEVIGLTLWERLNRPEGANDSDRLWGRMDNMDKLFIIRYFDIDPILKKRSYFFPE